VGEVGWQFTGPAVDPGPDRWDGVVVEQVEVGEDLGDSWGGDAAWRPGCGFR
jgi:hypothetical protein